MTIIDYIDTLTDDQIQVIRLLNAHPGITKKRVMSKITMTEPCRIHLEVTQLMKDGVISCKKKTLICKQLLLTPKGQQIADRMMMEEL